MRCHLVKDGPASLGQHASHHRAKNPQTQFCRFRQTPLPQRAGHADAEREKTDTLGGVLQRAGLLDRRRHQRFLLDNTHPKADAGDAAVTRVVIHRPRPLHRIGVLQPERAVTRQLHDLALRRRWNLIWRYLVDQGVVDQIEIGPRLLDVIYRIGKRLQRCDRPAGLQLHIDISVRPQVADRCGAEVLLLANAQRRCQRFKIALLSGLESPAVQGWKIAATDEACVGPSWAAVGVECGNHDRNIIAQRRKDARRDQPRDQIAAVFLHMRPAI